MGLMRAMRINAAIRKMMSMYMEPNSDWPFSSKRNRFKLILIEERIPRYKNVMLKERLKKQKSARCLTLFCSEYDEG